MTHFNLLQRLTRFPKHIAVITESEQITFNQLQKRLQATNIFLQKKGVLPKESVAFSGNNSIDHLLLLLSSWVLGFIFVPLNPNDPQKLNYSFDHLIETLPINEDESLSDISLIPLHQESTLLFTSGSSDLPKGVVHSVGNYICSAYGTNNFLQVKEQQRWIINLPLYHIAGLIIFVRTLLSGATAVLTTDIPNYSFDYISLVPTQLIRLLEKAPKIKLLQRCKTILLGGGPIPQWLVSRCQQLKIPVRPTYGMTESCAQITCGQIYASNVGKPLEYLQIKLDVDGTIYVKGETLFKYYLENGEKIYPSKWFATNDLGQIDVDGNLEILGRKDRVFISGGENVNPYHVEKKLIDIKGITSAYCLPAPHFEFGEVPWAFITSMDAMAEEEIMNELKQSLPNYLLPKKIIDLQDYFPAKQMKFTHKQLANLIKKLS